jgi:hypothetical protein
MELPRAEERAKVFVAVPLYCSADKNVFRYFSDEECRKELDAISAADLVVLIPQEVREQGNYVVYDKVRQGGRFQMEVADLPCIYLEDDAGGWAAVRLDDDVDQLRAVFKALSSAARNARPRTTASDLAQKVRSKAPRDVVLPLTLRAIEEGDFQRILNPFGIPSDPAMRRHELAKCEARVSRIDVDEKAIGTGWLVGPDLLLTAYHNVSAATTKWHLVTALFDHKYVPQSGSQFLAPGRRAVFVEQPLLASSGHPPKEVELTKAGATPEYLDFALLRLAERMGQQVLNGAESDGQTRGWFQLPRDEHTFDPRQALVILGHPKVTSEGSAYPLKLTNASPSGARLTEYGCRVRYAVNTDVGSSGSPVMDENFSPLALHHLGSEGKPDWDTAGVWPEGFNQGIPLSLIVDAIRSQVDNVVRGELRVVRE